MTLKCRECARPVVVPARSPAGKRDADEGAGMRIRPVNLPPPVLASLGWFFLGLNGAVLMPWLGLAPPRLLGLLVSVELGLTFVLIGWNLVTAVRIVRQTGKVLAALPLTLMQLLLFPLLFFQIACLLGTHHYVFEAAPRAWDWLAFILVHAFRAGDMVDSLEAYGLRVQTIQHASFLTTLCLVAFHLVLDVFLIAVLIDGWRRFKERTWGGSGRRQMSPIWAIVFVILVVAWLISALFVRPWRGQDLFLWPIDNALRVCDFADAMDLFHIRLHQVPPTLWEGSLTLACRLFMAALLLDALSIFSRQISLRWLGGFGLSEDDLNAVAGDPFYAGIRQKARRRLAALTAARKRRPRSGFTLGLPAWAMPAFAATAAGLLVLVVLLSRWELVVERLAADASRPGGAQAERALAALRRLGWHAQSVTPALTTALPQLPPEQQQDVLYTLGHLGPAGTEALMRFLPGAETATALVIIRGLEQAGPSAAPLLAQCLKLPERAIQQAARQALFDLGQTVIPPLVDAMTLENAGWHISVLMRLDPYWDLRTDIVTQMDSWREVRQRWGQRQIRAQTVRSEVVEILRNPKSPAKDVGAKASELAFLGPVTLSVVPDLAYRLDLSLRRGAAADGTAFAQQPRTAAFSTTGPAQAVRQALNAAGWAAYPILVECLAESDPTLRVGAAYALATGNTPPYDVSMALLAYTNDADLDVRQAVLQALRSMRPATAKTLPALLKRSQDPDTQVRAAIAQSLAGMGAAAAPAVPALLKLLEDADGQTRLFAITTLAKARPEAAAAVPALIKRLDDSDNRVRKQAAETLGQFGRKAVTAIQPLANLLRDSDSAVGKAALTAMHRIGPEAVAAVPALFEAAAAERLLLFDAGAIEGIFRNPGALSYLIDAIGHPDQNVRRFVLHMLVRLDNGARGAVPALVKRLDTRLHSSSQFDGEVTDLLGALEKLGPSAGQAVPYLRRLVQHPMYSGNVELSLDKIDPGWRKVGGK